MDDRKMLLFGLLGLILLMFAGLDWIILFVTKWLFDTRIISWIFSCFPNFISNVAFAAVQANLFCWSLPRLFSSLIHIKVQTMKFADISVSSTLKLELSLDMIKYERQNIDVTIRSMKITLDFNSNVSPWIAISIIDPCVINNLTIEHSLPKTYSQTSSVPSFLERVLNIHNGGLLQLFVRNVKLCVKNGTVRVVDETTLLESFVDLHFEEFGLREHRSISERLTYTNEYKQLYLTKLRTKIAVEMDAIATFYCSFFSLHIDNAPSKRAEPYESKAMNILLGRQYWKFDAWIQLVCFYLGEEELNENERKRGEILFIRQIDMKASNFAKNSQETGKLQIKVEHPISLEYSPELAYYVEYMFRFIAYYRPSQSPTNRPNAASNRQNRVPIPTSQQTFPAALDMVIDATFGNVSCLLWNEHNSCLLINWKNMTMTKSDGDTYIRLYTIALQLADSSVYNNPVAGNEKLKVDQLVIRHGDDNQYYQDLFIDLINPTATWNGDVHNHIKQMMKEMDMLSATLNRLVPPTPSAGKLVTIAASCHDLKIFIPLMKILPTVEIKARRLKVSNAGKDYAVIWDTVIYVGTTIEHEYLCIESEDKETRGGWIMTTHNKRPFEINKTTLYKVIFNGFLPIYHWLNEWW